jgi:hypothetical protein
VPTLTRSEVTPTRVAATFPLSTRCALFTEVSLRPANLAHPADLSIAERGDSIAAMSV